MAKHLESVLRRRGLPYVRKWIVYDMMDVSRQIGIVPKPGAPV